MRRVPRAGSVHFLDAVLDRGLEHPPALTGGQSLHHRDEVVGQWIAEFGEPAERRVLGGGGAHVTGCQQSHEQVERELGQ